MALDATQLNEVAAMTTQHINDEIPDLFVRANALYSKMYERKVYVPGGTLIQIPIAGVNELGSQAFISGTAADNLNLNINQIVTYGQINWKFFYNALTFDLKELTITEDSPHAIKTLVQTKVNFAKGSIARTLSAAMWDAGTTDTNSFTGMGSIFAASGTAYAGINDTDISNWLPYYPSASISAANYTNISPTLDELRSRTQQDGSSTEYKTDVIISDFTQYNAFKNAEQLKLRFTPSDMMKTGFTAINVDGIDWVADYYCPTKKIYVVTSKSMNLFYKYGFDRKSPLDTDTLRVPNQPITTRINFLAGNVGCTNRRVNAMITVA